jgi:hypothetical protein
VSGALATVFGLDVRSDRPLPFLQGGETAATGRSLDISLAGEDEDLQWPAGAELISDQRLPDGEVSFQIERSAEAGYRIWGPEYGSSVVSADGGRLRGKPGSGGMDTWQRMLVAQALPFAAVLNGLEVLHAAAVTIGGEAVGLAGPSGVGKTSLALELCRNGARFLADDVLALERVDEQLTAHPGTPVVAVDRAEAERLRIAEPTAERTALAVNSRERVEPAPAGSEPAPLRALFFIERRPEGPPAPRFEPAADAQALLASTFNLVLAEPRRLAGLLDVCALLARGRVERVLAGPAVGPAELAAAIERRIGASP